MSDAIRILLSGLAGAAPVFAGIWLAFWRRERRAARDHRERMRHIAEHYALMRLPLEQRLAQRAALLPPAPRGWLALLSSRRPT